MNRLLLKGGGLIRRRVTDAGGTEPLALRYRGSPIDGAHEIDTDIHTERRVMFCLRRFAVARVRLLHASFLSRRPKHNSFRSITASSGPMRPRVSGGTITDYQRYFERRR
jgi:hypothetical protein